MFDRLELSTSLAKYLLSISPVLGICGEGENSSYYMITKYFSLGEDKIIVEIGSESAPEELSLNLLRKGEDPMLIAIQKKFPIEEKYFQKGKAISTSIYVNSVISFECKLVKELNIYKKILGVYRVVQVNGVAGLDPDFNDDVTIAKTIEVMTLAAVDTFIINRKIGNQSE